MVIHLPVRLLIALKIARQLARAALSIIRHKSAGIRGLFSFPSLNELTTKRLMEKMKN